MAPIESIVAAIRELAPLGSAAIEDEQCPES
jgi:hypothetical protein